MNLAELFAPMPPNAEETWARLHAFASAWWREPGASDGVPSVDLDRAQARLGTALPVAVRNAYCFFGRYPEFARGYINLIQPRALAFRDDVLVLCTDDEQVVRWGIRRCDLRHPDPPVWTQSFMDEDVGEQGAAAEQVPPWVAAVSRFSAYFAETALFQAADSAPYTNWMEQDEPLVAPDGLVRISTGAPVPSLPGGLFYAADDLLVSVDGPSPFSIGIAAPSEKAYLRALDLFPGGQWRQDADLVHQPSYAETLADSEWVKGILRASYKAGLLP